MICNSKDNGLLISLFSVSRLHAAKRRPVGTCKLEKLHDRSPHYGILLLDVIHLLKQCQTCALNPSVEKARRILWCCLSACSERGLNQDTR